MTESMGWGERHEAARERARRAVDGEPTEELVRGIVRLLRDPADRALEQLGIEPDDEAWSRIVGKAAQGALWGARSGLVDGIAAELARPKPAPYAPPPAGRWIRTRRLPEPARRRLAARVEPTWDGAWHLFGGDWREGDRRMGEAVGRSRCGKRVTLRLSSLWTGEPVRDVVVVDEVPSVDVCARCAAIGGAR